jgi:hypothetical protein
MSAPPIGFDPKASMLPAGDGPIIGMKGGGPPSIVNITSLLDAIVTRLGTTPLEPGKEISLPKTAVVTAATAVATKTEGGSLKRKRKLKKHVRFVLKDVTKD